MAYALNRDILTLEQKRAGVAEYKARRKTTKGFSEWFTIDPAYPSFKAASSTLRCCIRCRGANDGVRQTGGFFGIITAA